MLVASEDLALVLLVWEILEPSSICNVDVDSSPSTGTGVKLLEDWPEAERAVSDGGVPNVEVVGDSSDILVAVEFRRPLLDAVSGELESTDTSAPSSSSSVSSHFSTSMVTIRA
ncbi:hypothetical protein MHYP_G00016310 [Metynnis hypsauchen]